MPPHPFPALLFLSSPRPIPLSLLALILDILRPAQADNPASLRPVPPARAPCRLTGSLLPEPYVHLKWAEWTELYGPVISVRTASQITVIIGRVKEAFNVTGQELPSRRGCRPLLQTRSSAGECTRCWRQRAGGGAAKELHPRLS